VDRKFILALAWLPLIALLLTACVRSASAPAPTLASASENPAPTPGLVSFPLSPASTWIYEYRAYTEDEQATWVVTETILSAEDRDGLQVAEVERLIRLEEGQPSESFLTQPESGTSWYVLRGGELFHQIEMPDPQTIAENAGLVMVFPPENIPCWPVDDDLGPLERGASGCRYVSNSLPVYETPAGTFENCLELFTPYLSGGILTVFCPNVGFVAEKYAHVGSSFGYEFVLTGYSLPLP
jgi:hypothetical protein